MKPIAAITVLALLAGAGCSREPASDHAGAQGDTKSSVSWPVVSDVVAGDLTISEYAARATLGNGTTSAAYLKVTNAGKTDDSLLSVTCDCATSVSLHTMSMDGNMMNMGEAKDGFPIPAGQSLSLTPGGNHIMLAGLKAPLKDGQTKTVVLTFARTGAVKVDLPVTNTLSSDGM
ncbi:hypothetical protein MMA231_03745 (plasmid) [Asticcacaulis sp. MM231]|uniref:copper chaperone PCu(A)C n=1 Tax=Asticcacaulis sp. MM231 TaxID=3157666 RepID=UPI0032D59D05